MTTGVLEGVELGELPEDGEDEEYGGETPEGEDPDLGYPLFSLREDLRASADETVQATNRTNSATTRARRIDLQNYICKFEKLLESYMQLEL